MPKGAVTSGYAGGNDPLKAGAFTSHGNGMPLNWHNQGADAGLYTNDDIHAVRILVMEPTTDRKGPNVGPRFYNHATERLRILGEIPLRKFGEREPRQAVGQPLDPDGNPDTSFLAKIPADTVFTFQTLDRRRHGAEHGPDLAPAAARRNPHNCGGCHAHSQQPTPFEKTAAAKPDYKVWDLTSKRRC